MNQGFDHRHVRLSAQRIKPADDVGQVMLQVRVLHQHAI